LRRELGFGDESVAGLLEAVLRLSERALPAGVGHQARIELGAGGPHDREVRL